MRRNDARRSSGSSASYGKIHKECPILVRVLYSDNRVWKQVSLYTVDFIARLGILLTGTGTGFFSFS
jgi:hypothetical protein